MFKEIKKLILVAGVTILFMSGYVYSATVLFVPQGGTGASTFTSNAILKGNGTGAVQSSGVTIDSANTVTTAGGYATTIANTANLVGLTITQNDTTNNPRGISVTNAGTGASLFIDANGNSSVSTSVGGTVLIENTGNLGSALVIYSNAGASTSGARLLSLRADNTSFDQAVMAISNDGTGAALSINGTGGTGGGITISTDGTAQTGLFNYTGTDASTGALEAISTNPNFSSMEVTGQELAHGTLKIAHTGTGTDADAAALSIDLQGSATAAQGIRVDATTAGGTIGNLLGLYNDGAQKLAVTSAGVLSVASNILPITSDGSQLGSTTKMFSDLFLASDSVVNWNAGDVTLTHSANSLNFGGASNGYRFDAVLRPASNNAIALGTAVTEEWSDLFLGDGGVIGWNSSDVLLTHSSNLLALSGGGFTVSGNVTGSGNAIFTNKVWANAGTEILSNEASYIVSTDADTGEYTDIQTAMDVACVTAGAVFIKAGTYTITSTLAVGCSDLTIYGEGESTIIQFNGSSVTNAFANSGTTQRSRLRIAKMKIISTSSGSGTGIELNYWRKSLFKELHIVDVNIGIHGGGTGVFYNSIENVQVEPEGANSIGFKFDLEGNDNKLIDTQVIPASGDVTTGYYIDAGGIWIVGGDVGNAKIGIDIKDEGTDAYVTATWLEANDINIQMNNDLETATIIGNHLSSPDIVDISGGGRGIFVQSHVDGDPLFYYGGATNVRFGIGTTTPDYAFDIEDTSLPALIKISGGGSNFVQSAIRLDSASTTRGNGIYTYDTSSLEEWYFGNPYGGNDAFTINRRANAASFNLDAADEADADVQNFFYIDSAGLVTLTSLSSSADLTVGDEAIVKTALYVGDNATSAGVLRLYEDTDDGANFASFQVPALSSNTVYTLPSDDGDSGEQLQTNGSGTLSWETAGSGSGLQESTYIVDPEDSLGDYTDIQSAIDALTSSGGQIFVREGTYTLSTGLTIADNDITIVGEGRSTIISFNASTVPTALSNSGTTQRTALEFRNLLFSQSGGTGGTCVDFTYFSMSTFENVDCTGANTGYKASATNTHYNTIISPTISVSGTNSAGITLSNSAIFNTVLNPRIITDTDSVGIYVDAHAFRCVSCNVETNALVGIKLGSSANDAELDVYLEGNQTNLSLASGIEGVRVTGFIADADVDAQNIVDNGVKSLSVEARVQYEPYFVTSSLGNSNDIQTLLNNNSGTTTYLNLESSGAFASSSPAITWENSAGALNTARIRSRPGTSYTASEFSIDVADSSKVLQERFEIDVTGLVTLGTLTSSADVTVGDDAFFNTGIYPDVNDGATIGSTLLSFSDVFLAEGGVINWDAGDATLTQANNVLTLAGADFVADTVTTNTGLVPDANDGAYLGQSGTAFSDLFLADGAVINFNAGNTTLTHSAGLITLAGAMATSSGVTIGNNAVFDTAIFPDIIDGAAIGSSANQWSDVFLAEGGVINFDNGDLTLSQSGNSFIFAGLTEIRASSVGAVDIGTAAVPWDDLFLGSAGILDFNSDITLTYGTDTLTFAGGTFIFSNPVRLKGYTVAGLPAGTQGDMAFVTDATVVPAKGVAPTAGGAAVGVVFYDGAAWVGI